MSGIPSTPIITIRPYILPYGAYTYFFGNNPSGPTTSSFTLTVNDFTSTVSASVDKLIIDNMSTGVYYSSFVVAEASGGSSLPANYRTVQFGAKPDAPTDNSGFVSSGKVILNFVPPLNDNGASIGWYVATASETNTRFNIKYLNSTITTSSLPGGDYNFRVHAVSDAGYSDPLYFSTLNIPSEGFTYFNYASYDNTPNYYYRIYNHSSQNWNPLIDSGLDTGTYTVQSSTGNDSEMFWVIYNDGSNYTVQFLNSSGLVTNITFPNNYNYRNSYKAFFYYRQGGDTYYYGIYDYATGNNPTGSFEVSNSYDNDIYDVDTSLIMAIFSNNDNINYIYQITPTTSPTAIFSTIEYSTRSEFNRLVFLTRDDNDFYNDVYHIVGNNSQHYPLTTSTYSSRSHDIFGIDNQQYFLRGFNSNTSLYDYYIFNFSSFNNPAIKLNIPNGSQYFFNSDYVGANKTQESNNFGISQYTTATNNISDGGGDMYDGGNFIDIYVSSALGEITNTDIFYGVSSYNNSTYGYYVGNNSVRPHTNAVYLLDGTARIVCHGNVGSDGGGSVANYSTFYTTASGRSGTIWTNLNYGAGDPTIGDVWFTVEKDTWSTNITNFVDNRKVSPSDSYNHYIEVSGQNFMLFKTLLSRTSGQYIDEVDVLNFVSSYVNDMDLNDSNNFNLINLSSFIAWNNTNASNYTSYITNFYNYAFDGNTTVPFFTNGIVHVYTDQVSSFSTFTFNSDKFCTDNSVEFNKDASLICCTDATNLYFKIITATSTLNAITNISTAAFDNQTVGSLRDYFFSVFYDINLDQYFTHIVGNDGVIYYSTLTNNDNSYQLAGNCMTRQNDSNQIDIFFNSTISTTSLTYTTLTKPFPDFGSSICFCWRNETSDENVLTVNSNFISTLTVSTFGNYNNNYTVADFVLVFQNNTLEVSAVNANGSFSTFVHPTSDYTNSYNTYYDDKSLGIRYISGTDGLANYLVYNAETDQFSVQTEQSTFSGSNGFYNNFFYND